MAVPINPINQDYVGKTGNQPKVYVAREAHATYFRDGDFRTRTGTSNHGDQYQVAPTVLHADDETGSTAYSFTLSHFTNSMISDWKGKWGEDVLVGADGPRSPKYRATSTNMWANPKDFHNAYLKLEEYPAGNYAHPELEIE